MSRVNLVAVGVTVVFVGVALTDIVVGGATGQHPLSEPAEPSVAVAVAVLHTLCYAALVAVLLTVGRDALPAGRFCSVLRWVLVSTYGAMAVGMVLAATGVEPEGAAALVVNLAFVSMLLVPAVLGAVMLARGDRSPSAWLLAAAAPALVLAVVLDVSGSAWAHPAYAEILANGGLALLGWRSRTRTVPAEELSADARTGASAGSSTPSSSPRTP
ncbi:hypothetical protein [Isoptericola sp. NPDC019482]|uniref:hypothetical protein n=1 Tax=Isoptericola sp. NPDC019482 TaxID=3154688 RepID=UPI00347506DC